MTTSIASWIPDAEAVRGQLPPRLKFGVGADWSHIECTGSCAVPRVRIGFQPSAAGVLASRRPSCFRLVSPHRDWWSAWL